MGCHHSLLLAQALPFVVASLAAPATAGSATCESLTKLVLPNTTIISAHTVAAGRFTLPPDSSRSDPSFFTAFETLREFCRVHGVIRPSRDSHVEFEVWLPTSEWNGKYMGAGNGGYGGSINYFRLAEAVNTGYAGSSTDTGHRVGDVQWGDSRAKMIDFDYRAVHETAETSKAIIRGFYGEPPTRSYFSSCSGGGRQGLIEARRYPGDYDGILAGAPALYQWKGQTRIVENLKPFKARGGRLILYHGWDDRSVAPNETVNFFRQMLATMGQKETGEFVRLYMVPGMGHCGGGAGPEPTDVGQRLRPGLDASHSMQMALEHWVEHGTAPAAITATKYENEDDPTSRVVRTRPVCPYPLEARWTGNGSVDEARNYTCQSAHTK